MFVVLEILIAFICIFIARGVLGDFFVYGIYNKTFSKPLCLMYCFLSRCCYIDLVDILFVVSVYDIIV